MNKKILLLIMLIMLLSSNSLLASDIEYVDMNNWSAAGPGSSNWNVTNGGRDVEQTVNGDPTFYISDRNYSNIVFKSTIEVATTDDDDFIGVVGGFLNPLDTTSNYYEMMLFDWKQSDQNAAVEGYNLINISGNITDLNKYFWDKNESTSNPIFDILQTNYNNNGWEDNQKYQFEMLYTDKQIKIKIDGSTIFNETGDFSQGRIGFYNYSQANVNYGKVQIAEVTSSTANQAPVAKGDSYGTDVNANLDVDKFSGLLQNDYDPNLDDIEISIIDNVEHGNLNLDKDNGSFSYQPDTDFSGKDSFTYKLKETNTVEPLESNTVTVNIGVISNNQAPTDIYLDNNIVDDDISVNSLVGRLSTVDENTNDEHDYTLSDNGGGRFKLIDNQLIINDNSDFNIGSSYSITVRSTDLFGKYIEKDFNIEIVDYKKEILGNENEYSIGEAVKYRITVPLKSDITGDLIINETLAAGMELSGFTINSDNNSNISYNVNSKPSAGDTGALTWDLSSVENSNNNNIENLIIEYDAFIKDLDDNNSGDTFSSSAAVKYNNTSINTNSTSITLQEPELEVSKNITSSSPYQAGDEISYTIEISHTDNSTADAYDLEIDEILEKISYTGYEPGSNDPGSPDESTDAEGNTKLGWSNIDLPQGSTYSFTIKGTFDLDIRPEDNINSSTNLTWTSTDGANENERAYSEEVSYSIEDPNQIKDITQINSLANTDIDPQYLIGEKLNYSLEFQVIKGTTENVELKASLPDGVKYLSSTITPDGSGDNNFSVTKPTADSTGNISWGFGTITNASDSNTITVDFEVQLVNSSVNNAGQNKTISAQLEYDTAANTDKSSNQLTKNLTIKEPEIKIEKVYPDGNYDAGDKVKYTLEIYHPDTNSPHDVSGYDLEIVDKIPDGMTFSKFDADNTSNLQNYNSDTKTLSWQIDELSTDYDSDNKYTLSYEVKLDEDVEPSQNLAETASVSWTSLAEDNDAEERNGSGKPTHNDYKADSSSSLDLKDDTGIKLGTKDGNSEFAVGEEITYQMKIDLNEGITKNIEIENSLPDGIKYIDHHIIRGNENINISNSDNNPYPDKGSDADPLSWSFSEISNPSDNDSSNDYLTIEYTAYHEENTTVGSDLTSTVNLSYKDADGNNKSSSSSFKTTVLASDLDESWNLESIDRPDLKMTLKDQYEEGDTLSAGENISYFIEIDNTGDAALSGAKLTAVVPSNTNYVADSTYVNGQKINDDNGSFPLRNGYKISSPNGSDEEITLNDKTRIKYTVKVVEEAALGTEIINQAKLDGVGAEVGAKIQTVMSDDPDSNQKSDKTLSIVGDVPLIEVTKEVKDKSGEGDSSGDQLNVKDTIKNIGTDTAENVVNRSVIDKNYEIQDTNSIEIYINNNKQDNVEITDNRTSANHQAAIRSIFKKMTDIFTPKALAAENNMSVIIEDDVLIVNLGSLNAEDTAEVTFDIVKKSDAEDNITVVESKSTVSSDNTAEKEADESVNIGNNTASIIETNIEVTDLNGGIVEDGDQLEYKITIENSGNEQAENINIKNNIPDKLNYVSGSAVINGSQFNNFSDLSSAAGYEYGSLEAEKIIEIVYRTRVDADQGNEIINKIEYEEKNENDNVVSSGSSEVLIQTSAVPDSVIIKGVTNSEENNNPENWIVELWSNDNKLKERILDSSGDFEFKGLSVFRDYTVYLKHPDNNVVYSKSEISFNADDLGSIKNEDSLLLDPEGKVYDSILRKPVKGAKISLVDENGNLVPDNYLADPSQQGQITPADGGYQLEIDFANAPAGEYRIQVDPPDGYIPDMPSKVVLPASETEVSSNEITDQDTTTAGVQVVSSDEIPQAENNTTYYLAFDLAQGDPGIFNNHIPVDPADDSLLTITKTAEKKTASVGEFVKYVINIKNNTQYSITAYDLYDKIPAGFKYVANSSVINHLDQDIYRKEPIGSRLLKWEGLDIKAGEEFSISYSLLIGSGAENNQEYVNRAYIMISDSLLSNTAEESIMVELDPIFSYTTIIGKVFVDINDNGIQDKGEEGISEVELITNEGQLITTDEYGRYSISVDPDSKSSLGETLVIKLVKSSLDEGLALRSTNPVIIKTSSGVMKKINFIVE